MLEQIITITGVSNKYWQPFRVTSPGGIPFSGYLCRQESDKFGLLAVTELGGEERLELIYGMPKIHYPYVKVTRPDGESEAQLRITVPPDVIDARFTVKLDGTAIIFYGLTDAAGNILEVALRTRLQPVLMPSRWGDWRTLLAEALPDRTGVERAVREERKVLIFELWGNRNAHLIQYDTGLALTLHTVNDNGELLSFRRMTALAERYGLNVVDSVAVLTPDALGLMEAYRRVQREMEERNGAANGAFLEEGAILVLSTAESAQYFKCKPPSIEEIHWAAGAGISRANIEQTLYKLVENGYDFNTGTVQELMTELESDFEPTQIESAAELIERVYVDFRIEQNRRQRLRQLVDASGLDPHDLPALMRQLAPHFSKKEMGWVYAAVKSLYTIPS